MSKLTHVKISEHYNIGLEIDEGSFLSVENTTRKGDIFWERIGERNEHINTNTQGRNLCDGGLQPRFKAN